MPRNNYAVLEGERLVAATGRIALARKHRTGIHGRRIIRLQAAGERIALRDMRGGTFYITGVEVN